jgi:S-adenosylmethionine synthetase
VTKEYVTPEGRRVVKEVDLFTWEKLDYVEKVKQAFGIS